ncbi:MAG TPA: type II toxin-antitoxin system VapB family antitoxin [Candidatus Dormibacteraeota bacterium]|nr:type II toxin-antitoxin system VapB family antitoxin [Candidatus Dormibacteraeota bacterium]
MARTSIDLDERACAVVMYRFGLATKKDAVNFALRELAAELSPSQARRMRGAGWVGDLDQMRGQRRRGI